MRPSRCIAITGTDTGVGKTWVGCALARALRAQGRRVVAIKPVETGCPDEPGPDEDGVLLALASGQVEPSHALVRLPAPVAPPVAADAVGVPLDFQDLLARTRAFAQGADVALVEGAGGLLSPLTWEHDLLDLAAALHAAVLLVASDRLGTVNHVRLTLRVLAKSGFLPLGVVLTAPARPDESTGANGACIARFAPSVPLLQVRRTLDAVAAAAEVAPAVSWLEVC